MSDNLRAEKGLGEAIRVSLRTPVFVVTVALLAVAAVGLQAAASRYQIRFRKEAIPPKLSLKSMNREALAPYRFVQSLPLEPEEEQSLGTTEYIHWILEDTSQPADSPLRVVRLFVTYYTGMPDQVPHVPDVCFLGGGYALEQGGTDSFKVPGLAALEYPEDVPYRALTFTKGDIAGRITPTVLYTFGVNGQIKAERFQVRKAMSGLRDRFAYFSKVEVSFGGRRPPDREAAVAGGQRVLATVLPLLVRDHWPDFKNAGKQDTGTSAAAGGTANEGTSL